MNLRILATQMNIKGYTHPVGAQFDFEWQTGSCVVSEVLRPHTPADAAVVFDNDEVPDAIGSQLSLPKGQNCLLQRARGTHCSHHASHTRPEDGDLRFAAGAYCVISGLVQDRLAISEMEI